MSATGRGGGGMPEVRAWEATAAQEDDRPDGGDREPETA
jgi:hypothetical protein